MNWHSSPLFSVIKEGDRYFINSCNTLEYNKMEPLEKRLIYLNNLTPQGIKEYYQGNHYKRSVFTKRGVPDLDLLKWPKSQAIKLNTCFSM